MEVNGPIVGRFTSDAITDQKLFRAYTAGEDFHHPIGFFAIFTGGKLDLYRNDYGYPTVVRPLRVKGSDVDYVIEESEDGLQGENFTVTRVVSLRDPNKVRIMADVGNTMVDTCVTGWANPCIVSAKVSYRESGTAMDILPFDQYVASCETPNDFKLIATTRDDSEKVLDQILQKDPKPEPPTAVKPEGEQPVSYTCVDVAAKLQDDSPADRQEYADGLNKKLQISGQTIGVFAVQGDEDRELIFGAKNIQAEEIGT